MVLCNEDGIKLPVGGNGGIGQHIMQGFNVKKSTEGKAVLCNVHTNEIKRARATTSLLALMIGVM